MKISASIQIKAPVSEVFRVFSNLADMQQRIPGIQKIEVLEGPAQMAVGTKWRETRVMFGKEATEEMAVTELATDAYYKTLAESHGMRYEAGYRFEPVADDTKVTMEFIGTPLTLGTKLFAPIFAIFFKAPTKKALLADMESLKQVLEKE